MPLTRVHPIVRMPTSRMLQPAEEAGGLHGGPEQPSGATLWGTSEAGTTPYDEGMFAYRRNGVNEDEGAHRDARYV